MKHLAANFSQFRKHEKLSRPQYTMYTEKREIPE